MADWSQLGELLTGGQPDIAYAKGRYQSAQTEAALSQAEERRQQALALEMLPKQLAALPGMTPELSGASAGSLAAGGAVGDAVSLMLKQQEFGNRQTLADPLAGSYDQFYAGQGVQGKVLPRYEFGPGGEMVSDLSRPEEAPQLTPTGVSQVAADKALAVDRLRPPAPNATSVMLGLSPEEFAAYTDRQKALAAAKGEGAATGKGAGQLIAARPAAEADLKITRSNYQRTRDGLTKLETDPDLWKGVGLTQKIGDIPGNEGDRVRAEFDAISSQLSILALSAIRAGSKTGGAVGQVTENEWPRLADQFGAWSRDMKVSDFRDAARNLNAELGRVQQVTEDAFNTQYGAAGAAPTGGAPAAAGSVSTPKTQAEYDALPPGAVYIDTDGVKKRKKGAP